MNAGRTLGVAVLTLGVVLLGFAYHFSEAPIDQISNALTGRYTDSTMWYIIAGIAAVVAGGFLTVSAKRI
jgi:drug/metabolite transporter (DMT)-like permease